MRKGIADGVQQTHTHDFQAEQKFGGSATLGYMPLCQPPHMYYITSTLLFLLLILDFVRFFVFHTSLPTEEDQRLRKIAKCIYFYYIT